MSILMGLIFIAAGVALWWTVAKYSIRADAQGIRQTNGFIQQTVNWSEVTSYFVKPNERYYGGRRLHVEPVLLDAEGTVIFRGFAHLLVSTRKIIEQRRELWRFVEAQLEGKKVEAPPPDFDPGVTAVKSLEVDWSKKSLNWKIKRILGLACYALFWVAVSFGPIYYFVSRNIQIPSP